METGSPGARCWLTLPKYWGRGKGEFSCWQCHLFPDLPQSLPCLISSASGHISVSLHMVFSEESVCLCVQVFCFCKNFNPAYWLKRFCFQLRAGFEFLAGDGGVSESQLLFLASTIPLSTSTMHPEIYPQTARWLVWWEKGLAAQLQILLLNIFSSPRPLLKESCRSVRLGTMRHWELWEQMWGFLSCFPQQKHTGDHSALPVQKMVCPASEMLGPETAVPLHSIVRRR